MDSVEVIEIANSLSKIETTIAAQQQAKNSLWYLEVLDKAADAKWILTTHKVEQLIGVKPHYSHNETSFARGN